MAILAANPLAAWWEQAGFCLIIDPAEQICHGNGLLYRHKPYFSTAENLERYTERSLLPPRPHNGIVNLAAAMKNWSSELLYSAEFDNEGQAIRNALRIGASRCSIRTLKTPSPSPPQTNLLSNIKPRQLLVGAVTSTVAKTRDEHKPKRAVTNSRTLSNLLDCPALSGKPQSAT